MYVGPCSANDAAMSEDMCVNNGTNSTLIDDGYPQERRQFIVPDDSDEHKARRTGHLLPLV